MQLHLILFWIAIAKKDILTLDLSDAFLEPAGKASENRHLRNLKPSITSGSGEERRGVVAAIAFLPFSLLRSKDLLSFEECRLMIQWLQSRPVFKT